MATEYLFSNNATTTLAQSVSATATVLNVASGTGSMFPSPVQGQAFAVTLVDAATGLTNEICYCTSRSGDQLTVVRGREGTNATTWQVGDTCANYITADVMESWLQESDLNGYATQSWVDSRYISSPANPATDYRIQTISRNKVSGGIFAFAEDGSNTQLQPSGDYATNAALTQGLAGKQPVGDYATNTALAQGLAGKANLNGGNNLSGSQYVSKGNIALVGNTDTPDASQKLIIQRGDSWQCALDYSHDDTNGNYSRWIFYDGDTQNVKDILYYFLDRGRLSSAMHGDYALVSELLNLQNQINGKQPSGNYVTGTSAGKKIVTFTASVSGTQDIPFSGLSRVDVVLGSCSTQPGSNNQRGGMIQINSWTSNSVNVTGKFTSTNISDSTDLPCYFVAIGDA